MTTRPDAPGRARDGRAGYALGPATRLLWRTPDSVQLEVGAHGVVVDGLPGEVLREVVAPHGSDAGVSAAEYPVDPALDELAAGGFLWPRRGSDDGSQPLRPPAPRLAGELAALAAEHKQSAAELLRARARSRVHLQGSGRALPHLAALLAAAGVGRVSCAVSGSARLANAMPGGVGPSDEGRSLSAATDDAIHRAAPEVDTTRPVDEPCDLTVLVQDGPVDDDRRIGLHAAGAAHLVVSLTSDGGIVGPLVLPGLTSCLRCADLQRRDRDPAWPALAVQLTVTGRYGPVSTVAGATIVAGVAAVQALTYLDGGQPACIEGTLELHLPDWRLRRRTWPLHPDCDCLT